MIALIRLRNNLEADEPGRREDMEPQSGNESNVVETSSSQINDANDKSTIGEESAPIVSVVDEIIVYLAHCLQTLQRQPRPERVACQSSYEFCLRKVSSLIPPEEGIDFYREQAKEYESDKTMHALNRSLPAPEFTALVAEMVEMLYTEVAEMAENAVEEEKGTMVATAKRLGYLADWAKKLETAG